MDPEGMRGHVDRAESARLATASDTGAPHIVPCCFVLVRGTVYTPIDGKPKSGGPLRRVANIRSNPKVSLLVDYYDSDWSRLWWVRLDGVGRLVEGGSEWDLAIGALRAKYPQYEVVEIPGPIIAIDVRTWRGWP
jgi:PPOX class probable F420-dependent enzyme